MRCALFLHRGDPWSPVSPQKSNPRMGKLPLLPPFILPHKNNLQKIPPKPLIFSPICVILSPLYAGVMELADVLDSKSTSPFHTTVP